jgi:hypothetical protein
LPDHHTSPEHAPSFRRSVLLREPAETVDVRVLDGYALHVHQVAAPTIKELYCEGEVIEDLDLGQARDLIACGIVEAVG